MTLEKKGQSFNQLIDKDKMQNRDLLVRECDIFFLENLNNHKADLEEAARLRKAY